MTLAQILTPTFTANLPQSENHANFELTYPRLLVFTLHWEQVGKFSKNVFFHNWLLILSMPHVRGCLKTSSQDNCVWSDPFCTVNSEKTSNASIWERHPATFLLVFLEMEAWEDTNTWTTATILAWYPQKIVVEHRLPPVMTWGCGTPGNNLCETWFEILREKCRENFWRFDPYFTQPKRRNFSHEIPLSFPQGFPHGFPRRFLAWETERLPLTKAYPNQYSPDKGVVLQNLCSWQVTLPKKKDGGWLPLWLH